MEIQIRTPTAITSYSDHNHKIKQHRQNMLSLKFVRFGKLGLGEFGLG